eukprot:TRINITY_DN37049_c0_g1_i6.p2 TRINITY_DN37049_c0_g1~~TRINITY_DN37049_c0_g1_i6.p2  ORF type:complete len:242 (-),score=41.24 TRINITY_DN37049_c0_g1_i6:428-1123(-)
MYLYNFRIIRPFKVCCVDPSQYRQPKDYSQPRPFKSPPDYSTPKKGIIQPNGNDEDQMNDVKVQSGYGAPKSYSSPPEYSSPRNYRTPSYAVADSEVGGGSSGGDKGGNGNGGEGGGRGEGGSSDDSSGFVRPLTLMYAVAIAGGGLAGYVRKQSKYSLLSGLIFAAILFVCWQQIPQQLYLQVALGVSVILCGYMGNKYLKSEERKFMPTGMISTMSGCMALTYLLNGAI